MNGETWLLSLELPSGTVFLSDGGVTPWNGDTYRPSDASIGSVATIGEIRSGFNSRLPEQEFTFAVPDNGALTALQAGAWARSSVRLWVAEYDTQTGQVVGTPDNRFSGKMDRVRQQFALKQLSVIVSCVSEREVALFSNDNNGLSAEFHKGIWPNETGHDQATGLVIPDAWGVESGTASTFGTTGGGGSQSGSNVGVSLL